MYDWHEIDELCANCGKKLVARWAEPWRGYEIQGARPIEVEHADGTTECIIWRKPACPDIFSANKELSIAIAKEVGERNGQP